MPVPEEKTRSLWISGLSSSTHAKDLKTTFSNVGKVAEAKVFTNAGTPGLRCYGYVTMHNSENITKCIQSLNQTELQGRHITVEKAKENRPAPANPVLALKFR